MCDSRERGALSHQVFVSLSMTCDSRERGALSHPVCVSLSVTCVTRERGALNCLLVEQHVALYLPKHQHFYVTHCCLLYVDVITRFEPRVLVYILSLYRLLGCFEGKCHCKLVGAGLNTAVICYFSSLSVFDRLLYTANM